MTRPQFIKALDYSLENKPQDWDYGHDYNANSHILIYSESHMELYIYPQAQMVLATSGYGKHLRMSTRELPGLEKALSFAQKKAESSLLSDCEDFSRK